MIDSKRGVLCLGNSVRPGSAAGRSNFGSCPRQLDLMSTTFCASSGRCGWNPRTVQGLEETMQTTFAVVDLLSARSLAALALIVGPGAVLAAMRDAAYKRGHGVAWETSAQVDRLMRRKPEAAGR